MQQKKTSNMTKVTRDSLFWYSNQQGDVCLHNSVSRIFNSHSGQFPFIYSLQVPALIYEENYKQKQNKEAFSEILTLFYLPIFYDFLAFLDFPQWVIRTICIYSDFFFTSCSLQFHCVKPTQHSKSQVSRFWFLWSCMLHTNFNSRHPSLINDY